MPNGNQVMETINGEVVDERQETGDDLDRYIEDVATNGFPLGFLARAGAIVKGLVYCVGAAALALIATFITMAGMDFVKVIWPVGALLFLVALIAWIWVVGFAIMGLANCGSALLGRMPVHVRQANDAIESVTPQRG